MMTFATLLTATAMQVPAMPLSCQKQTGRDKKTGRFWQDMQIA